jgi:maleylpyruvate isomerase
MTASLYPPGQLVYNTKQARLDSRPATAAARATLVRPTRKDRMVPDSLAPGNPVMPAKLPDPGHAFQPDDRIDPGDPAGTAARLQARVATATSLLRASAERVTDAQAREPSLLPGWSRGHLLTHIARNADSLRNLLIWARTGVPTPQYSSSDERSLAIERGAGRPAAELLADLDASAAALEAAAALLPAAAWAAQVRGAQGNQHTGWYTLWRRLTEVEIHHVDLGVGYSPADWPQAFAAYCLEQVAASFAGSHSPAATLQSSDVAVVVRIGPPGDQPATTVTGPVRALLAWLTGRSAGDGLTAEPAGPLPAVPSW